MPNHVNAAVMLVLLASLAACAPQAGNNTDALDNELVNGIAADVDPALTSALGNEIVVDPARAKAIRPVRGTASGGSESARQAAVAASDGCDFKSDLSWAIKLPAAVGPYPGAKVTEAAGSDEAGCHRRIVSFTTAATPAKILAYYSERVAAAGYTAEHLVEGGADILGGTRGEAAYYLTIKPAPGGSTVDLVAN